MIVSVSRRNCEFPNGRPDHASFIACSDEIRDVRVMCRSDVSFVERRHAALAQKQDGYVVSPVRWKAVCDSARTAASWWIWRQVSSVDREDEWQRCSLPGHVDGRLTSV